MSDKTIQVSSFDTTGYESAGDSQGDLTDRLIAQDVWTDQLLNDQGIPIVDAPIVTVGGGIGSFVLTDFLRIAGMPATSIRALSVLDRPWQTYEYLTGVSQIPPSERLRSDSGSTPGNIWGFPAYSLREAWSEKTLAPVWNVLTEPILTDYWTPKAAQVFAELQREADRIGWWGVVVNGQVRMVRRRSEGGYFTILTPPLRQGTTKRVAFRSTHVHLAVGYPGVRFLPDLQEYRQKHRDYSHVVNAYEPHEQVYEELRRRPGVVVVRGGGIVASRVLQRLIDDRDNHGARTEIVHLFRTYITRSHGPNIFMRRKGANGWAYQGFNWPKGAWGGQTRDLLDSLEGADRKALYEVLGGTNTPHRKLWLKQLARGRKEGWYRTVVGQVVDVHPSGDGGVTSTIRGEEGSTFDQRSDFIIDATGLEADIREHRVLADLLDHSGAARNPLGRLDVERTFEIRGTRSGTGRMYASGSPTLGGYYAGVDSFLGLQYAALKIADDLAAQGFCRKIGTRASIRHWFKWMRNERI